MRARRLMFGLVFLLLPACGGDNGTGPAPGPTFENIAGTYNGPFVGVAQGSVFDAVIRFTILQSGGDLSGTWRVEGDLDGDLVSVSSPFTGTIASGTNPAVSFTVTDVCPDYSATFSGSLNSSNGLITVSGPVAILNFEDNCVVEITFQGVIVLTRS